MKHPMLDPVRKDEPYKDYVIDRRETNLKIDQYLKKGRVFYAHPIIPYVRIEWTPGGKYYQENPKKV